MSSHEPNHYRWRTNLRGILPPRLAAFIPKGKNCGHGHHEFYLKEWPTVACYHCRLEQRSVFVDRVDFDHFVALAGQAA